MSTDSPPGTSPLWSTRGIEWRQQPGALAAALRVAGCGGRPLTPALCRAIEIVTRQGVVVAGRHTVDGSAPASVILALARPGRAPCRVLDDEEPVDGRLAGFPSAEFSAACLADLDRAAAPAAPTEPAELASAARAYLAALDARRTAATCRDAGGAPIRGQALANLSTARQRELDQAEATLRRAVDGVAQSTERAPCPG